jgi:hypothetical protein
MPRSFGKHILTCLHGAAESLLHRVLVTGLEFLERAPLETMSNAEGAHPRAPFHGKVLHLI